METRCKIISRVFQHLKIKVIFLNFNLVQSAKQTENFLSFLNIV